MERYMLDTIEHEKLNARIKELELMVNELRLANVNLAAQVEKLDTDLTTMVADVTALQKQHATYVTTVTPEDNYYAVMDAPIGP